MIIGAVTHPHTPLVCCVGHQGALGRLQPADREIIQLAGWEQLGRSAIATAMQCTPNAVTKRLNRALDRLARELGTRRSGGRFFRSQGVS